MRRLHGELRDSASGAALRGAEILITGTVSRRTRTDAAGHFEFARLPAAAYTLRVRLIGFAPLERVVNITNGDATVRLTLRSASISLDSVVVLTDALPDPLSRVAATSTIDAAELSATRGQTLGETIKLLPGVSVVQFGPSIAKPVIRGLNSQRVLVMNAGLRQEDQQWGTEHAPNIDSFDADKVTVVRGAATVLYGPDAIVTEVEPRMTGTFDWAAQTDRQREFRRTYPRRYYDYAVRRVVNEMAYHNGGKAGAAGTGAAGTGAIMHKSKSIAAKAVMWWIRTSA